MKHNQLSPQYFFYLDFVNQFVYTRASRSKTRDRLTKIRIGNTTFHMRNFFSIYFQEINCRYPFIWYSMEEFLSIFIHWNTACASEAREQKDIVLHVVYAGYTTRCVYSFNQNIFRKSINV